MKIQYFIETRNKNGQRRYGKPHTTKESAEKVLAKHEAKMQWARLVEYCGLFPVIINHTSLAMLELTKSIRESHLKKIGTEKAIAACDKHITELEAKLGRVAP